MGSSPKQSGNESWEFAFKEYLLQNSPASEDTVKSYIRYIKAVSSKLNVGDVKLMVGKDYENTIKTIIKLDLSDKTKRNYSVAIKWLNHFYAFKEDASQCADSSSNGMNKLGQIKPAILGQINEMENKARDYENGVWQRVFSFATAYFLLIPQVLFRYDMPTLNVAVLAVAVVMAFGGICCLIPVLQRQSRQTEEICKYGSDLVGQGKNFGCYIPVSWSRKEKMYLRLGLVLLLMSVLTILFSMVVDKIFE